MDTFSVIWQLLGLDTLLFGLKFGVTDILLLAKMCQFKEATAKSDKIFSNL